MPDADLAGTVDALMGAAYGSAGERCMAISVAVPVGREMADRLVEALARRVETIRIGPFTDADSQMGPLISQQARQRVLSLIESGKAQGARVVVDGGSFGLHGCEDGFFVGATLFDHVGPAMDIYTEEIFGPVLSVVRADTYEEALGLAMRNPYGNGATIFTRDGDTARDFAARVNVGMVGVNVAVPVPLAYHSFGGWKDSSFGDLNQHGTESVAFWTQRKTVTSRWSSGIRHGADYALPTMR
jgi:malonate-semialdehyde dehydrogenase (acetylating)/methylmalonate-semialdehyde dehydrogenase